MRITAIETHVCHARMRNWVFVKVITDQPGLYGWGEATLEWHTRSIVGAIEDLAELSVRSRNSLQKENIQTLGDLVQRTEEEMLGIENFGKKSLTEITAFLDQHELNFGMRLKSGDDGRLFLVDEDAVESAEMSEE